MGEKKRRMGRATIELTLDRGQAIEAVENTTIVLPFALRADKAGEVEVFVQDRGGARVRMAGAAVPGRLPAPNAYVLDEEVYRGHRCMILISQGSARARGTLTALRERFGDAVRRDGESGAASAPDPEYVGGGDDLRALLTSFLQETLAGALELARARRWNRLCMAAAAYRTTPELERKVRALPMPGDERRVAFLFVDPRRLAARRAICVCACDRRTAEIAAGLLRDLLLPLGADAARSAGTARP